MERVKKRGLVAALLAVALLLGTAVCFAAEQPAPLGTVRAFCSVDGCVHTAEAECTAYAAQSFLFDGSAAPHANGYYGAQLGNDVTKRAVAALDAFFNPNGRDIPTPRLGIIAVHSLPANLTESDLTAIRQQVVDILCIDRPEFYWLDKNNLRFGLQSGTKSSVLIMDFSDRILNPYISLALAAEEGKAADAAAQQALARIANVKGDVERLRILHDFVLEQSEFTYELEQAYSFTGVLVHKRALCEGYAKAFQLLARRAGYECELVVGDGIRQDGTPEAHMWNAVQVGGLWYLVDCTWDDSQSLSRGDKYRYFLLSAGEARLLDDHREDGNINLKTLPDKTTPSPGVQVFRFPQLASASLKK